MLLKSPQSQVKQLIHVHDMRIVFHLQDVREKRVRSRILMQLEADWSQAQWAASEVWLCNTQRWLCALAFYTQNPRCEPPRYHHSPSLVAPVQIGSWQSSWKHGCLSSTFSSCIYQGSVSYTRINKNTDLSIKKTHTVPTKSNWFTSQIMTLFPLLWIPVPNEKQLMIITH